MFYLVSIKDIIRILPSSFSKDVEQEALEIIRNDYEDLVLKDIGYVIAVVNIDSIGMGKIIPREEGIFTPCVFNILVFRPEMQEVIEGQVVECVDFGIFVRIGPTDGLCHVSQVTDDYINYNQKMGYLEGKETGRILQVDDLVRARIVAISTATRSKAGKLGLMMRRPYLGKLEWIQEDLAGGPKRDKTPKKKGKEDMPGPAKGGGGKKRR